MVVVVMMMIMMVVEVVIFDNCETNGKVSSKWP